MGIRLIEGRQGWLKGVLMLCLAAGALPALGQTLTLAFPTAPATYTPGVAYVAGTSTDYVLTISNQAGAPTWTGHILSVPLPTGVTWDWSCAASPAPNAATCAAADGTGAISNQTGNVIPAGGSLTFTFRASYAASMSVSPLNVTATARESTTPTVNKTATASSTLARVSDLSVSKSSSWSNHVPLGSGTYTVAVVNAGPSDGVGIGLTDTAPSGTSFGAWTCNRTPGNTSCGSGSGNLARTGLTLPAGSTDTYTIPVSFLAGAGASIQNTATVTSADDPDTSNNTASVTTTRHPSAELNLAFVTPPAAYVPGTTGNTLTLRVTKSGTGSATAPIALTFPAGVASSISWACTACTPSAGTGNLAASITVAAGTPRDVVFTINYLSGALSPTWDLLATLDVDSRPGADPVPDPADKSVDLSLAIDRRADISIVKTASATSVPPGIDFTYDLLITNNGPSDVGNGVDEIGLRIDDVFAPQLRGHNTVCSSEQGNTTLPCWRYCPTDNGVIGAYTTANCPVALSTGSGNIINRPLKLRAGSSSTVRISARVGLDGSGDIANVASVALLDTTPAVTDTDASNNSSSVSISAEPSTDIVVEKTDGLTQAVAGSLHSYTVTVSNNGFFTAANVAVLDQLPLFPAQTAGFEPGSISWQCRAFDGACCVHNGAAAACGTSAPTAPVLGDVLSTGVDLPGLSRVEFTISGRIDPRATGVLSNTARADLPPGALIDIDLDNNESTDTTTLIQSAQLGIQKRLLSVEPDGAAYRLRYEIMVTNAGPSRVVGATVEDLPSSPALPASAEWDCEVMDNPGGTACGAADGTGALSTTVDLDANGRIRFELSVMTQEGANGQVTNIATISAGGDTASASVVSSLGGTGDLAISKDDQRSTVTPGTLNEYTITVTNSGPNDVFGASIIDELPPELEGATWTCEASTPVPGDLALLGRAGGTTGAAAIAISADGRHVYTASQGGKSVSAYSRNSLPGLNFGGVELLETEIHGVNDPSDVGGIVTGLQAPVDLALSPNGAMLFVLSQALSTEPAALVVFDRVSNPVDPNFGRLSFVGSFTAGLPGTEPKRLAVTSGNVYVTGVKSGTPTIAVFRRSLATGLPTFDVDVTSSVPANPGPLVLSSGDARLFVASTTAASLASYTILPAAGSDPAGRLSFQSARTDAALAGVADLVLAPAQKQLYAMASGSGRIVVLSYATSLSLLHTYSAADLALGGTQTLQNTSRIALAPDGEHLLLANAGTGGSQAALLRLRREPLSGGLGAQEQGFFGADAVGLPGASEVAVTPDGRHVLISSSNAGAGEFQLAIYSRRAPDPVFGFLELDRQGDPIGPELPGAPPPPRITGLNSPTDVAVSPDRAHVYSVSLDEGALVVFRRNALGGNNGDPDGSHLSFQRAYLFGQPGMNGLQRARRVLVSPNGESVYVTSEDNNTVAVFHRNTDVSDAVNFGNLTAGPVYTDGVGGVDGLLGANGIAMDAGSNHLYVAGAFEAAVAAFRRNANGSLTYLGVVKAGAGGAVGMNGMRDLIVSGDGKHVIGISSLSNAVVVLNRNSDAGSPGFGQISFLQAHTTTGVRLMALSMPPTAIDPTDNSHIYVVGQDDSSLIVLRRVVDPSSTAFGRVSTLFEYRGLAGLHGPRDVVVGADGRRVFVGSQFGHSVLVLDRDMNRSSLNYGGLYPVEVRSDGADGVDGLNNLYALATSSDARNVYVAGFGDRAIASFSVSSGSFCSAAGSGSINDLVNIGAGGTLVYRVSAMVRPDATGILENCASVVPPDRFDDPDLSNNTDCDSSTLVPEADVSISKTNDRVSVVAGEMVRYQVRVSNPGPSNLVHSPGSPLTVSDIFSGNSAFVPGSATWTCEASGSGSLDFIDLLSDGMPGLPALGGVTDLAVLPDQDGAGPMPGLLAAASVLDNAVTLLRRDPGDGRLTPAFTLRQGDGLGMISIDSLAGARAVLGSSDGRFLYVAASVSDAITVLRIDSAGGGNIALHRVEVQRNLIGLDQAVHMAMSPDGGFLYVAGANDDAIAVFQRDPVNGGLTWIESVQQVTDPNGEPLSVLDNVAYLAISPDGVHLYALAGSGIARFERNAGDGRLSFRGVQDGDILGVGLAGLASAVLSSDGEVLYAAAADDNRIAVLARDANPGSGTFGSLSLVTSVSEGVGNVLGLLSPRKLVLTEDERHLYVASQLGGSVAWFSRDPDDGGLRFLGLRSNDSGGVDGLAGATGLAIDDVLGQVYAAGTLQSSIVHFSRNADSWCPPSGIGDINQVPVNIAAGGHVLFTIDVQVSSTLTGPVVNTATVFAAADPNPDNNSATDTDSPDLVADLSITKDDGLAAYDGLAGARALAGTGTHLYVAGSADNGIGIFARQSDPLAAEFGDLRFRDVVRSGVDGVLGLNGVSDLLLSGDGAHLYAVSPIDNALVVFSRHAASGALSSVQLLRNGVGGVNGMSGARAIASSPNGSHLYVASEFSSSIAIFSRNTDVASPGYGQLSFMGALQQGIGGVDGIAQAQALVVAPDGMHVYALGTAGSTLAVFRRNPNSASSGFGQLTFLKRYAGAVGGASGLESARWLQFAPDGASLYVLGSAPGTLTRFARDASTGDLALAERIEEGQGGAIGLAGAERMRLSHDASQLYVAGGSSASVSHYDVGAGGVLSFAGRIANGDPVAGGGSVAGLNGASDLLPSPDGEHVYVAAFADAALSGFDRVQTPDDLGDLAYRETFFDGLGGVAPGSFVTYTIVVSNAGPANVAQARVVDVFPAQFVEAEWECTGQTGGGQCLPEGTGNMDTQVSLPAGASVTFQATGLLSDSASGTLVNTATVTATAPAGQPVPSDPDLSNNSATDGNTVLSPALDLEARIPGILGSVTPGASITYQVEILNHGPTYATGATVSDLLPFALRDADWSCVASPVAGVLDSVQSLAEPLPKPADDPAAQPAGASVAAIRSNSLGQHVYVVGTRAGVGAVSVYRRNALDGSLTWLETHRQGWNGVNGIAGAVDLVLSGDERFLYVAGNAGDAVALFSRDTVTGRLTWVRQYQDGVLGIDGLGGVRALLLSPGGSHLYAAGQSDNAIAIFAVNAANGLLTQTGIIRQTQPGIDGLSGVNTLAWSETGTHLLATALANQSLAVFARNPATGALSLTTLAQAFEVGGGALSAPVALAMQGNRALVGSSAGGVDAFRFDPAAEPPSLEREPFAIGSTPAVSALRFEPDQARLYLASQSAGELRLYSLLETVPELLAQYAVAQPRALALAPGGNQLYSGGGTLDTWARERGSRCGVGSGLGGIGRQTVDIAPNGRLDYLVSGTIFANAIGDLAYRVEVEARTLGSETDPSNNVAVRQSALQPAPTLGASKSDGRTEVVAGTSLQYSMQLTNAGVSAAVAAPVIDLPPYFPAVTAGLLAGSGSWTCSVDDALEQRQLQTSVEHPALEGVAAMALSPDGSRLYAVSAVRDALLIFHRGPDGSIGTAQEIRDGDTLGEVTVSGLDGASAVAVSKDGRHLVVAGTAANSVVVFAYDEDSDSHRFVQKRTSGSNGVVSMAAPEHVVFSASGGHVFVAAQASDAIVVFRRDMETGELNFVERVRDGFGTVSPDSDVIRGVQQLHASADGRHLYALSRRSRSIAWFGIDSASGVLSYGGVLRHGSVPGIDGTRHMAASPGDAQLYVLGASALVRFARQANGSLLPQETMSGQPGLSQPRAVLLDRDGSRTYLVESGGAISVYLRDWGSGVLSYRQRIADITPLPTGPVHALHDGGWADLFVALPGEGRLLRYDELPLSHCPTSSATGDVIQTAVDIDVGGRVQLGFAATVHPSARGLLSNRVRVEPPAGSAPGALAAEAVDETLIRAVSDLSVQKNGPALAVAGTLINYQIVVANAGPSDALDLRVVDLPPAALLDISWTCSASGSSSCPASGSGTPDFPATLKVGDQLIIGLQARIDPSFIGELENRVQIVPEAGSTDPSTDDLEDGAVTQVSAVADVSVTKSDGVDTVVAGTSTVYRIEVSNAGPSDAPQVRLLDAVPEGIATLQWSCAAVSTAPCSLNGAGDIDADVSLPAGTVLVIDVDARIDSRTRDSVVNTVSATVAAPVLDPDLSNNEASDENAVEVVSDLMISLTDPLDPFDPGGPIPLPYLIEIDLIGPSSASEVELVAEFSHPVSFVPPLGCSLANATLTCQIDEIEGGAKWSRELAIGGLPPAPGFLDVTAVVSATEPDPDTANNSAFERTELLSGGDVAVSIERLTALVVGDPQRYRVVVTNLGSQPVDGFAMQVPANAYLVGPSWSCSAAGGAACPAAGGAGGVSHTLSLERGQRVTYLLEGVLDPDIDPLVAVEVVQTAQAVPAQPADDINPDNNSASDRGVVIHGIFRDGFEGNP